MTDPIFTPEERAILDTSLAVARARIRASTKRLAERVFGHSAEEISRIIDQTFREILDEVEAAAIAQIKERRLDGR